MENFNYQEAAAQKASEANQSSLEGRKHRDQYRKDKSILDAWAGMMSSAHPVTATIIAIILALLNMVAGWEMNRDLIDQSGVFNSFGWEKLPFWVPLIIALPLELLAFWVASWLGKSYNDEIFELEVWNRMYLIYNGNYHRPLAVDDAQKSRKSARFWFWLLLVFVLTVQGGISWHRIQVLEDNSVGMLLAVFALAFILGEIVAGVYADHLLKRWHYSRSCNKNFSEFRSLAIKCASADRMVVELLGKWRNKEDAISLNGDMKHAIYRNEFRCQDDESYIDEVSLKQAAVEVRTSDETPVANARVIGLLPRGLTTDAAYTNSKGLAKLHWDDKADTIECIKVNGVDFFGPFRRDVVHLLHLPLPSGGNQPLELGN